MPCAILGTPQKETHPATELLAPPMEDVDPLAELCERLRPTLDKDGQASVAWRQCLWGVERVMLPKLP